VKDLKKSTAFYRDGLGFPHHKGPSEDEIVFFSLKGSWLALFPREELAKDANVPAKETGFPGFSLGHVVDTAEEVDELLTKAISLGATITLKAKRQPWGGYSGYFSDPDGYLWEIVFMDRPLPFD